MISLPPLKRGDTFYIGCVARDTDGTTRDLTNIQVRSQVRSAATAMDRAAVNTAKNQTLDFKNSAETAASTATQAAQLANQYKIVAEAAKIQTGLDVAATAEDRQVVEAYVGDINNLVTIPFAQFATDLIRTQTIVVEHHGFT